MKKQLIVLLLVFIILPLSGCLKDLGERPKGVTLNYWRVWDGSDDFAEIIASYSRRHPYVTIKYKKLRYDEFEQELIEAFATDRGPDIFSIHNTWMYGYQARGLLSPMPPETVMTVPEVKGSLKKEVYWNKIKNKSPSLNQIRNDFVDTVYNDIVINYKDEKTNVSSPRVFGLPLSVDTLAMFYNKDLFNNAGITSPPEFWNREFQQDVKKLTKQNNKGEIIQSGVALGGSDNIERSTDILSALMMQNGAQMMQGSSIAFHRRPMGESRDYNPGIDALRFYSDFANPAKEVYSWNSNLENSLDLFIANKLAMMFGYSYMLPIIKSQAPKLNFSVTALPQIEGNPQSINFANYWVEVVSNKCKNKDAAWDFIKFITTNKKAVKSYLDKTQRPTALRSLIDEQIEEEIITPFVNSILTAKSWYRGNDAVTAEKILNDMIDKVVNNQNTITEAVNIAAQKVQQTIKSN